MVNNPNAQVIGIFPTPIYIGNYPNNTSEMVKYFDSQEYSFAFLLSKHDKLTLAYRFIRIEVQDVSRGNVTGPDEHHRDQTDL